MFHMFLQTEREKGVPCTCKSSKYFIAIRNSQH